MKTVYRAILACAFLALAACTSQEATLRVDAEAIALHTSKMGNADLTTEDVRLLSATFMAITYYRMCAIHGGKADYAAAVIRAYKNKGAPPQKTKIIAKLDAISTANAKPSAKDNPLCQLAIVSFAKKAERDLAKNDDLRLSYILGAMLEHLVGQLKSRPT